MHTKNVGEKGELTAVRYFLSLGYRILERNFRKKLGELDIVARDGTTLVFVEVKSRASFDEWIYSSVSLRKKRRIQKTIALYLAANPGVLYEELRFDVILITQERVLEHFLGESLPLPW